MGRSESRWSAWDKLNRKKKNKLCKEKQLVLVEERRRYRNVYKKMKYEFLGMNVTLILLKSIKEVEYKG